jgi:beta-glucosidase-like glycosyl hydrolase
MRRFPRTAPTLIAPAPSALLVLLALLASFPLPAASRYADALAAQGRLSIPLAEARALESVLGQLLVVNVDGFGYTGNLALEPGFVPMMERLQVGGVIPHYGSADYQKIRRTNRALAGMTTEPLLLCCDIVAVAAPGATGGAARTARFGDGYAGGFIGRFRGLPDEDYRRLAAINAFAFAALGMNVALGPTVDDSTGDPRTEARARALVAELRRFGILPVLKHYPFLPREANLHRESPDTKVALRDVEKRAAVFARMSREAPVLMTTHLADSLVDRDMVTFSAPWNRILRRQTGFDGLLMSDGLLMLGNYAGSSAALLARPGTGLAVQGPAAWAARAILAGHDLVIVEGTAAVTYMVFEGLLAEACGSSPAAGALRARITGAAADIATFKKRNARVLRRQLDVPDAAMAAAVSLAPGSKDDPSVFRVDKARYEALEAAMRAARLP